MKVRIIKDKHIYLEDVVNVVNEDKNFYYAQGITGIFSINKEDAEVVQEVKKSCKTCNFNVFNTPELMFCDKYAGRCDNYEKWQPIELKEEKQATGTTEEPKQFTRSDLTNEINQSCDDIKKLFSYKNEDYGMADDAFANFRKTAERMVIPFMQRYGVNVDIKDAMYLVLSIYVDKHAVALSQTGLKGNEVAERLGDIANYSLIAKAMLKGG